MSRIDQITLKGPLSGNKRSHAMNSSRRVWNVNLQTIRMTDSKGRVHKVRVSARTIKTLNHTRVKKSNNKNIEK